ncbi:ABC transporter substrate-binding protein [Microbacterium sp. 1P10UB]|uniref:ABC transporter substrate-binding protein n=1 Tax=unclassified Microbacterium TaxID=2609290 RepID=UPI00399FF268
MRRRITLAAAALVTTSALLLTACSGSPAGETTTSTGPADSSATLRVGLVLEPSNLDIRHTSGAALEQVLIGNVYEGLVSRSQDNEVENALATDHTVSDDGLTYTFTLAQGVAFHSGDPLTVDDVVSSFTQVKDDETIIGHADFANVASIAADGADKVVVTLTTPDQNFLFNLTGPAGLVVKAGDTTDLKTAENGTGPFTLTRWNQGDSLELARNDAYWGEPAGVASVVLQYIPDFTAGVNAALDGSLDVLTAVDPTLAPQLDGAQGFSLTTGKTTDKATLAFNNKKAPLDDKRVREALRLAINHDDLVTAVGAGQTMYGPIPELDPGYEDLSSTISYDPERAKELLKEAGAENLELTLTIPSFYGTTVPQVLVSDFEAVGVDLTVDAVEFSTWLQDVYTNRDYDLSFVLHVEPRDFGNFANPDYYFGYDNPDVQKLYQEALATVDPDESADLLKQAAKIVSEDSAADWLYNGATITAVQSTVSGFPVDSINSRIDLAGVTVSK